MSSTYRIWCSVLTEGLAVAIARLWPTPQRSAVNHQLPIGPVTPINFLTGIIKPSVCATPNMRGAADQPNVRLEAPC